MTRRDALALLAAVPLATRAAAQSAAPARARRVISQGPTTFLIELDGTVKAWSLQATFRGYLGLGGNGTDRVEKYVAYAIPGMKDVVTMAAANSSTYALLPGGSIVAWGANSRGELGITPRSEVEVTARARNDAYTPTPVVNVTDAIAVAAGESHALALTRAGTVLVWGYNLDNQLGIEMPIIAFKTHTPATMDYLPFPLPVPGLTDVSAIAGGEVHSLALRNDGTVWAWGGNRYGQLGDGTVVSRKAPVQVVGVRSAVAIAAEGSLSAALLADGAVMTWGFGNNALGRQPLRREAPYPTPALVPGVGGVRAIALGSEHMLALTRAGTVLSWGDTRAGEVGHDGVAPKAIVGMTGVASIAATTGHSFVVLDNGTIMVCGQVPWWPRVDPFGDPTVSHWPIPLVVKNLKNPM